MKLDEKFNNQAFSDWVEDFLLGFSRDVRKVDVPKSFSGVKAIHTLGESLLGVRVYTIEMDTDPSKRKVGLATDSFSLLRNYGTPNAIVVYFSGDSSQWRLSLLTSTPVWNEGKIITKLSNPKRQSYVLGPKAKVKTPHQYLVTKGAVADFTDLKSRFSLEVVNKEFYKEISQAFIKLVGGTLSNGRSKQTFKPLLRLPFVTDKSQTSLEFAVRLIGRIIFCWFLREKRSASGNTLMPKELLSSEASNNTEDYYHRILEPIFFEILNKPIKTRKDAYGNELFSAIPYLNGGLFSPHEDDFFNYNDGKQAVNHNMVIVPDEWLRSLLEVLETYNFTIDENTSFDEELSIDPEMLGRIFENLLAEINPETGESARKSTGSYYTPRVIVDYMVDESLKLYLKTKTNISEEKLKSLISYDLEDDETNPLNNEEKDKIAEALGKIKILDPACGSGAFPIGALQKIVFILQQIDKNGQLWFKKQIQNTPVELRRVIEREFQEKNFDYIRKLGIIRENIYGIDIQPIATEISRLRCFLTLVVDERVDETLENRGVEPLPNLDFKFVTANTLIGLPTTNGAVSQMGLFEDDQGIKDLKEVRDMFFNASGFEREQLKLQFVQTQNKMFQKLINEGLRGHADMTSMLTTWDPFSHKSAAWFDPEWMFGIKDGFDIVIANPPYIGEKYHKNLFDEVKKSILIQFYNGQMDYFYFFFHFALNINKDKGITAFISTNYYPTARGARKLRKDFKDRSSIIELVNFNELKIFESAKGQHNMITLLQKEKNENTIAKTSTTQRIGVAKQEVLQDILYGVDQDTLYSEIKQKDLYDGDEAYIRFTGTNSDSDNPTNRILSKIQANNELLGSLCHVNVGLYTGADKITDGYIEKYKLSNKKGEGIFVINEDELENLTLNSFEKSRIVPFYKNSDIDRWYTKNKADLFLINLSYPDVKNIHLNDIPNLYRHVSRYEKVLKGRKSNDNGLRTVIKSGYWWAFTIRQLDFTQPKIVSPQRSSRNTFGWNVNPWYASADVYFITQKVKPISLKYVLALLNSKLYYLWLYHRGKRKGETLELYQKPLSEIPIKKVSPDEQKPFIDIVDRILINTTDGDYLQNQEKQENVKEYEMQINKLVYNLYDLTPEEIATVEKGGK